ncbi:MAG: Hsp20/alpha crystallin family protein [Xanthobacteraceae bacterium]|nr:Hsp20/alpha crystallin family protein [Xanthobacteraceae bacterium]
MSDSPERWMWAEAIEMLARADRLHRQMFQPRRATGRLPTWEPPADVLETEHEVLIVVALPGVDPDRMRVAIEGADLVVAGTSVLPVQLQDTVIHRLELPRGHFERRIQLPPGRYGQVERATAHGFLVVTLTKTGAPRG